MTAIAEPLVAGQMTPAAHAMVSRLERDDRFAAYGRVTRVAGLVLEATGLEVGLGALCRISSHSRDRSVLAEVVGFQDRKSVV